MGHLSSVVGIEGEKRAEGNHSMLLKDLEQICKTFKLAALETQDRIL